MYGGEDVCESKREREIWRERDKVREREREMYRRGEKAGMFICKIICKPNKSFATLWLKLKLALCYRKARQLFLKWSGSKTTIIHMEIFCN